MITENHGSDAWVDLLALETYFQALHLENDAFGFAWGLTAKKQARGLGMLKCVSCDLGGPA